MCPLCSSKEFEIIGKPRITEKSKKVINKDYNVVRCSNCGFYFVHPVIDLSEDDWKFLYDETYFEEPTRWYKNTRKKYRKERIDKLEKYCANKIENFLDVGCGEGLMLLEAVEKGWNAYGVDIADNRIDEAKTGKINFTNSDLLTAKFPDDFFDCVYMDSVLEHVKNPMEHLMEIHRILKVGGVVYIGVPNEDSLLNDFKKLSYTLTGRGGYSSKIKPFVSPYHIGGFNKSSLSFALNKAELKSIEFRNFALRLVFRMAKFPSKEFLFNSALTLLNLIAFVIRREYYLEVYAKK